jgi:hypothetical protein
MQMKHPAKVASAMAAGGVVIAYTPIDTTTPALRMSFLRVPM